MPKMTAQAFEEKPLLAEEDATLLPPFALDDIPDPPVPQRLLHAGASVEPEAVVVPSAAAGVPLTMDPATPAGQVAMTIDEALWKFSKHASTVLAQVETSWQAKLRVLNLHQDALATCAEVLRDFRPTVPFSATVHVESPAGYTMTLSVQERTQEAFLTAMGSLMQFVQTNGFKPYNAVPF